MNKKSSLHYAEQSDISFHWAEQSDISLHCAEQSDISLHYAEQSDISLHWAEQSDISLHCAEQSDYYYYYFGVRCARPGESEDTSVQRPQPHTTNPSKEEKDKTVADKKERADHANSKALALLLKPASPTPSNTGSLRSF